MWCVPTSIEEHFLLFVNIDNANNYYEHFDNMRLMKIFYSYDRIYTDKHTRKHSVMSILLLLRIIDNKVISVWHKIIYHTGWRNIVAGLSQSCLLQYNCLITHLNQHMYNYNRLNIPKITNIKITSFKQQKVKHIYTIPIIIQ